MKQELFAELQLFLQTNKKVAVIPHRNPDGDAMGSTLGLKFFLEKMNHQVTVVAPNDFPDFLSWLPDADKVVIYENDTQKAKKILEDADIIFTLDFNVLYRVGEEMGSFLSALQKPFVMIDHHQSPADYAKYTFSDTNYGSTCQMVYDFINQFDALDIIDKSIATCLYTGILTDSGGFRYPKTTGTTHRIVANLIEKGADNLNIPILLFDNNSYERLQLMGRAFQNMKIFPKQKTTYIKLTQADLDEFHYKKGDTEGLVNYGLTIKGIDFAAIFIENAKENLIKISFRSQGTFDVNEFARKHFEGGGHINAAGGKSTLSMEETIKKFEAIIDVY